MMETSPLPEVHGTKIEDAVCESLNRLSIAFDSHPQHLPRAKTANYWGKIFRGERAANLGLFVLALQKAERAMSGPSFVSYVLDPLLALFDLEATPRGLKTATLKDAASESFDAHRTTTAAEHVFDEAAADDIFTETERREITHRVTIAQEELGDLADVAAVGGGR